MKLRFKRTDHTDPDFMALVAALDSDLAERDGEEHGFYDQFNGIEGIRNALVAYASGDAIGCGAIRPFSSDSVEIKRMYVVPKARGQGFGSEILECLEQWAAELGYNSCVLETGKRQPEAIGLYGRNGYVRIPNYGPYQGVANSVCFKKSIS